MSIRRFALPLALALVIGIPAGQAFAGAEGGRGAEYRRAIQAASVNAAGAATAVQAAGYTTISRVKWERGAWLVRAVTAEGARAKLRVDATTGVVTPINR